MKASQKFAVIVSFLSLLFILATFNTSLNAQSDVTNFSSVMVSNAFRAQPRPALTVINGGAINATGTFQRIQSAGAVGTAGTAITIKPAGWILTLLNVGANTITITETGVFTSAGNIVLGPGDATQLYSNGSAWTQVGGSNN